MSSSEYDPSFLWLKGPAERVLAATVARRFLLDGLNKVEIAEELGLSRFKVARLLDAARHDGLVKIEIGVQGGIDLDLSTRLQERFGLAHAVVVDAVEEDMGSLRRQLGRAAGELLTEIVGPSDVLGLAWSRAVGAMVEQLRRLARVPVVQLTGVLSSSRGLVGSTDRDSSIDVVRETARVAQGPAHVFFAPFLVTDPQTARALRRQPELSRVFAKLPDVTIAVLSVGRWVAGHSTLFDAAAPAEQEALGQQGVCAEMAGIFLTAEGRGLKTSMSERIIAVNSAQLQAIPMVVALAYGLVKRPAVSAALRSGLLNGLVTHTSLAEALLSSAEPVPESDGHDAD